MPEHAVIKPVLLGGEICGFADIAHVTEIGGCALGRQDLSHGAKMKA
jgi:hypothetical protein